MLDSGTPPQNQNLPPVAVVELPDWLALHHSNKDGVPRIAELSLGSFCDHFMSRSLVSESHWAQDPGSWSLDWTGLDLSHPSCSVFAR